MTYEFKLSKDIITEDVLYFRVEAESNEEAIKMANLVYDDESRVEEFDKEAVWQGTFVWEPINEKRLFQVSQDGREKHIK